MIACVYKIKNIVNGKEYVGSALHYERRKKRHLKALRENKHHSYKLQYAFNKYGEGNFSFEVIEGTNDNSQLLSKEQFYIDTLNPAYNICMIAGSSFGIKHSEQTREKMRNAQRKYFKSNSAHNKGKPFSIEARNKMSIAKKGKTTWNKGIPRTQDVKDRISKLQTGGRHWRAKAILQYDLDMNFIKEWDCTNDAVRVLNLEKTGILSCLKRKQKTAKGFIWKLK